ncbi:hypothetical protein [Rickettsiella endosymbiont of Dermanyssus gallinae]|uniref:hypothetical protein n=2 Tax=Rickettsiella endosymbiont of Dermanyssus gallinae TaxID=2856608 RepID=UPI001C52BB68|nr:hypothetical protein [Rickettsiella endosymbiont of Dermanyssus gallinae]
MDPNTDIPVSDSADKLLQRNQLLSDWLTDCLLPSKLKLQVWTPNWAESLRIGHRKADSKYIKEGYKLLTKQLDNNNLQLQYSTDDHEKNDRVSALLLLLLAVHVYRETATECHRDQSFELQTEQWEEHATCVMRTVPTMAYLNQLHQLVDEASKKKPINSAVDHALLGMHQHALKFCFKQLLDEMSNTTKEGGLPPDKKFSAYEFYIQTICMAHVYITQLSTLPSTETEHLPNLLLKQLTELIKKTSTLDLSPSWMECLKRWIQECFSKLQSLYKETSSTEKTSSALRVISERLRKSTKKMVRKKKLPFPESIREHCWMYFSLHEKLITEWWDKEQHTLEYQSSALALFESFMSTFDWPSTFEKGIVNENPLKTFRSAKRTFDWLTRFKEEILYGNSLNSYCSAKQAAPLEQWEHLVDPALNKLSDDFFIKDWFGYHDYPNKGSFLHWLVSRHELRPMRQESIVKAMRSRRARDRRALTGEAGNASRRKVICGRHGHELRRSECVPDAGRIAA